MFVDRVLRGPRNDQGNPWATKARIVPFKFDIRPGRKCFGKTFKVLVSFGSKMRITSDISGKGGIGEISP
jgi:hypothetical protein